ncbi:hypothetical protein M2275_008352 [Rhodococcus opacus]|jgi:hypothetical protein|nr:hypothetical protein [Rhodococcus opacus]
MIQVAATFQTLFVPALNEKGKMVEAHLGPRNRIPGGQLLHGCEKSDPVPARFMCAGCGKTAGRRTRRV